MSKDFINKLKSRNSVDRTGKNNSMIGNYNSAGGVMHLRNSSILGEQSSLPGALDKKRLKNYDPSTNPYDNR